MKDSGKRKAALVREVQQLRKQVQILQAGERAAFRAERALAQYWNLLDAILSGTGCLYALKGADYRYQAANQAFCRLVGLPEHEIRGRGDFELFPNPLADVFHRDDVRVLQAAVPASFETRVALRDCARWLRVEKRPVIGTVGRCAGVLAIINDISDLAGLRGQQRILAHPGNHGYWCTDTSGVILDVNHAYCAATGHSTGDLVGKSLHEIEVMNTPESLAEMNRRIVREGFGSYRTLHRGKNDKVLEFEVDAVYSADHGGRFYRYFRLCPDSSATAANGDAGATAPAGASPGQWVPAIPLSHRKVLNLNTVLLLAIDQEIDQIPPGISVRKRLAPDLRNTVANQPQIMQVIVNIVANAVEAMNGRGHLTFTSRNVELTREWLGDNPETRPGHYVYLAIGDTGRGINPNLLGKVFDPFITTKFKGRGMGLASVARNISEHHGLVTVKSDVGKGSTFAIYLPATDAPVESGTTAPQIPAGTETILLVDPESRVLEEARCILERLAYTVLLTTDIESAITRVRTGAPPVDLIVVDTAASMARGQDFMAALRQANPNIKIVLAGAHELDTWSQDILDNGAHGFVKKPFRPESLAPKIRQTLDS